MMDRIAEKRKAAGEGGFTLIELLVVIIILGILAAVVVFAVGGIGDKGQTSACKIDTRTLRTAEEAHFANAPTNGTYASEADLLSRGFLSELSDYHDIAYTPFNSALPESPTNPKSGTYVIRVADDQCGTVGNDVGETASDF